MDEIEHLASAEETTSSAVVVPHSTGAAPLHASQDLSLSPRPEDGAHASLDDDLLLEESSVQVEAADTTEDDEGDDDEGSLDVVVTGVEVDQSSQSSSSASVVAGAALLLGNGLQPPYIVELVVTRSHGSYCIRRDLTAFLSAITSATTHSVAGDLTEAVKCPEFPPKHNRNDAILAQWCADVTQFLSAHASELHGNQEWVTLVADSSVANAQHRALMTAIEFILQPFPFEKIYVPRGSRHEVVLPVKKEDQFLVWRFEVQDHDIDLTVHFLPSPPTAASARRAVEACSDTDAVVEMEVIHPTTRYVAIAAGERPIEGMYQCTGPGTATLVWDNSYSRLRGKNVQYQAQVVHKSIMSSAVAAADAYDEAIQAKIQREELIRSSKKKHPTQQEQQQEQQQQQQLVVSPRVTASSSLSLSSSSYLLDTSAQLYRQLFADKLPSQNWLVSAPMTVAGKLASRLFGSPQPDEDGTRTKEEDGDDDDRLPSQTDGREAKSLLEELNGLNMQLLERLEHCEDTIAKLTVERDQEKSRMHLTNITKGNATAALKAKELELQTVRNDLQRFDRERDSWREIQQERDALLEEKHRWAMAGDFTLEEDHDCGDGDGDSHHTQRKTRCDLDPATQNLLEQELGKGEATVLRLRAELGYPLTSHLTGTSTRLEKIAREMTQSKKQYDDQMVLWDQQMVELKQEIVKYRSQKRVLVAEIKNLQFQSSSQVAVAMAEANEARMVNRRLKTQNQLLLTQIKSLVDDARDQEEAKKLQDNVEQKLKNAQLDLQRLDHREGGQEEEKEVVEEEKARGDDKVQPPPETEALKQERPSVREPMDGGGGSDSGEGARESTVPYTLRAEDVAMLNGQPGVNRPRVPSPSPSPSRGRMKTTTQRLPPDHNGSMRPPAQQDGHNGNPYRAKLVAFFHQHDPSRLSEVDEMLQSYAGVEPMLFESLELKYNFMALHE